MILKTDSTKSRVPFFPNQVGRYFKVSGKFYLVKRLDITRRDDGDLDAEIEVESVEAKSLATYKRVYGIKLDLVDLVKAASA